MKRTEKGRPWTPIPHHFLRRHHSPRESEDVSVSVYGRIVWFVDDVQCQGVVVGIPDGEIHCDCRVERHLDHTRRIHYLRGEILWRKIKYANHYEGEEPRI